MDRSEKKNNKRQSAKKVPRLPIKTYKWEDIRRSRRKGGYPWTYLYKEAFNELVDDKEFTMDGLRKNKTSSASSASDSLDIKEITEDDVKGLEDIDSSYVVIEGPILLGGQVGEATKDQEGIIESADSSDNISQYLDKEDRGPGQQLESTETLTLPGPSTPETLMAEKRSSERAKSEEPKKKRKLSIESNYSRISLSRLGLMKRLREVKDKMKIPKLGGTTEKKTKPETEETQPESTRDWMPKPTKHVKPVYIHIPLKPAEGKTDEFSYLEFEEKRPQAPLPPPPDVQIEEVKDEEIEEKEENISEPSENDEIDDKAQPSNNSLGLGVPKDDEDDVSAIIFLEGDEEGDNKEGYDIMVVDINEDSQEMTMSQVTNTEVRKQVLESIKKSQSRAELNETQAESDEKKKSSGGNLSRSSSKTSRASKSSVRKRRAKSAEPDKKRRSSIDSSYSRKSLSKIGLLKKLKEFHLPFMKSPSNKSVADAPPTEKEDVKMPTPADPTKSLSKDQKPVYIHIPLKPPPGQKDQYSHLEFEAPPPQPKQPENEPIESNEANECPKEEDKSPVESPQAIKSPQFIFLTPPSDDELLDRPDIPETPSSETGSLFHFGELKNLAKKAVEEVHGPLEEIDEEMEVKSDATKIIEDVETQQETKNDEKSIIETEEKVMIDEEDGLKSTQKAEDENKSTLKSNLKAKASPLPKKKVSFKRRKSSQVSKNDGYEEIQSPSELSQTSVISEKSSESTSQAPAMENMQSISLDEEKSYLDSEKVIKSTSLEEDYNKWSKISDHEYEPVNPPPDVKTEVTPPKSHVSEVLNPSSHLPHQYSDEDTQLDLSVQEMQTNIENRFFNNKDNTSTNLTAARSSEKRTSPSRRSPSKRSSRSRSKEKEPAKPSKFQLAMKESATKFKTKLQSIKKPNVPSLPRPKFQKPNIKKPNINLLKMPNLSSTFRRSSKPDEKKEDPQATSSEEPAHKGQGIFDFSTYPRLFKKKKQVYDSGSLKRKAETERKDVVVKTHRWESSTKGPTSIRIPLHSEDSMDQENGTYHQADKEEERYNMKEETGEESSPPRYQEDIDADDEDARQRERQERHRAAIAASSQPEDTRWDHGNFHQTQNGTGDHDDDEQQEEDLKTYEIEEERHEIVTDLDQQEEVQQPFVPTRQRGKLQQNDSIDTNHSRDVGSSVSSLGQHRRGVLEEIDSDQFFLREKGISQDNIDMGRYLSTEIREAFRSPNNALADMRAYNYEEIRASNQSLPETKKKQMKKPKRRKTPHASQERLRYEQESENEDYNFMPPIRPRRRSKRRKKPEPESEVIAYPGPTSIHHSEKDRQYLVEPEIHFSRHYENNEMEGKEHPDIRVTEPYKHVLHVHDTTHRRASEPTPAAPARKHKSLKSLNASEHESIFDDYERDNDNNNINGYADEHAFDPPQTEQTPASTKHFATMQESSHPPKPPTRSRSKTLSASRPTSQADVDSIFGRSDSIMFDEENREPVVEEPCIKDLRDAMGYAIVDKNQNKNWEHKFCTVPRSQPKDSANPPERPLRNYSTLGPSRPPRKLSRNMTDEEKENIDITQYIEIEDERDLQSGEVIQKMQNRPLPAPPRPPRSKSKPLQDITSESNLRTSQSVLQENMPREDVGDSHNIDETEVSTQTEPLPDDFVCEEVVEEESDKIMTPSAMRKNESSLEETKGEVPDEVRVERVLITPTQYSYQEETITHGQLLVEPLNGAKILPDSELSRERIIPITSDEDETSEIPETFNQLSDPKPSENNGASSVEPQKPPRALRNAESVDILKTKKLQVSDLDVDRLTVNELVANKIIVSEIDSGHLTSDEINTRSGALKLGDIELEPNVVKKLLEQLQRQQQSILEEEIAEVKEDDPNSEQKKTPMDFRVLETSTSQDSTLTMIPSIEEDSIISEVHTDAPLLLSQSPEENMISVLESIGDETAQPSSGVFDAGTDEECVCIDDPIEPPAPPSLDSNASVEESDAQNFEYNIPKSLDEEECTDVNDRTEAPALPVFASNAFVPEWESPNSENDILDSLESNNQELPVRPPRNIEKKSNGCEMKLLKDAQELTEFGQMEAEEVRQEYTEDRLTEGTPESLEMLEPEIDDEPPPRPPQPQVPYVPSQPPASFYALRAQHFVEGVSDDIPLVPRRKRHQRPPTISKSSSSESSGVPMPRRRVRSPEPSIPQLTCQLVGACSIAARNSIKRLIEQVNSNIATTTNSDEDSNRQNVQVIIVILLVLIAGLLLLGYGDGRTVHLHHWEYFNPPKDI